MSKEAYKLKINELSKKYYNEIRPLQSAIQVIDKFNKCMDIYKIKESDLSISEQPHFRFLRSNYENCYKFSGKDYEFIFFVVEKNEKSKKYYDFMENKSERIIVAIEPKTNYVSSSCRMLQFDIKIEIGIDSQFIENETIEFLEYLLLFEFKEENLKSFNLRRSKK